MILSNAYLSDNTKKKKKKKKNEEDTSVANGLRFNCSQRNIVNALQSCTNIAAGPDGVLFHH